MSMVCRFGDEESTSEVPCRIDETTNEILCERPRKRANLRDIKMKVKISEDEQQVALIQASGKKEKRERPSRCSSSQMCTRSILAAIVGEFIGTCLLTLVICTTVVVAVITGAHVGLWQVAVVCGLGVALSIYLTSFFSDAHLNPAVTLTFALVRFRSFNWLKLLLYTAAQMSGGVAAGGILLATYGNAVAKYELENNITRGDNGSELSAMIFGEYFPNPAIYNHKEPDNLSVVSLLGATFIEGFGTAVLVFTIFALTEKHNHAVGKDKAIVPILIGLTVTVLISLYAPLTQAGFNPARDFGPRLVALMAGWGRVAVPGPRNGFWVYIVGPLVGGPIGGLAYDIIVANVIKLVKEQTHKQEVVAHPIETTVRLQEPPPPIDHQVINESTV